ncbi:zinc finger protein 729 [Biomphalaria pfeifferi]|uniref:Zinc finger protein 729 n=1 Tax=Biomphalaria pfeifferi TaxID=112525 RepID=A0AAD8ASZ7_BIOPF|nr:zinc finger protein 729 [Biomphalaria pfeifferi]
MDLQSRQQFQCVHCNRRFRRRHSLTVNLKKYLLVYTCSFVTTRFGRECPYTCRVCNRIFLLVSPVGASPEEVLPVWFVCYKGTQGTTNQSSQSIDPFKIQNLLNSNNYQSYRSQPKKNNNYGTSSQTKDKTDIPIESHNLTGSRKFLSDVVFQCQQRFPGTYPQFCKKKFERHCDMKKHLHSHMKSSELMSKYNTLRTARESNQSTTSFNMHIGVHLNEYPPKQIQIHQQAFCSHRDGAIMNMSAMRNYYIFRLGNENFATSSSLNNHIDKHSVLTRLNQKLIEETTFPPLHWDAKAHVMPDCSSYGPDRVHNLEGLQHGPDRVHNLQRLHHGPERVHTMQAPCFTEKITTQHVFEHCLNNGMEKGILPMIPTMYDHAV